MAKHNISYFRKLFAALLAAPNESASARGPYQCTVHPGRAIGLVNNLTISVYPLSFSIPEALFQRTVPSKAQNFSSVIPGVRHATCVRPIGIRVTFLLKLIHRVRLSGGERGATPRLEAAQGGGGG